MCTHFELTIDLVGLGFGIGAGTTHDLFNWKIVGLDGSILLSSILGVVLGVDLVILTGLLYTKGGGGS